MKKQLKIEPVYLCDIPLDLHCRVELVISKQNQTIHNNQGRVADIHGYGAMKGSSRTAALDRLNQMGQNFKKIALGAKVGFGKNGAWASLLIATIWLDADKPAICWLTPDIAQAI